MSNTGTIENDLEEPDELTMALHSAITNLMGYSSKDTKDCDRRLIDDLEVIIEDLKGALH